MCLPDPGKRPVLEIGCADGGNLVPLAVVYPESTLVGIDLSQVQIAEGQETVRALGLTNIELGRQSVLDVTAQLGAFDYVICHGVYSWVPADVQQKILEVCKENLAPQGVAYVSYNTLPGWHMRGAIRDMMIFHTQQFTAPAERAEQARALLDFLAASVDAKDNPYGLFLASELALLRDKADSYLLHDHLEEHNEPLYFHEFMARAAAHGLRYLGEADPGVMVPSNFPPQV